MKRVQLPRNDANKDRERTSLNSAAFKQGYKFPVNKMSPESAETEAERQLQNLLKRQMETNYTVDMQFQQHRQFKSAITYRPLTAEIAGTLSAEEFKQRAQIKDRIDQLRLDGLGEEEIQIKMQMEEINIPKGHFGMEPSVLRSKVEEISAKIKDQNETISGPTLFRGAKGLTRHEMEIEKSLKPNSVKTKFLGILVADKETANSHQDDPINHLKEMEEILMQNVHTVTRNKRKRRKKTHPAQDDVQMDLPADEVSSVAELTWKEITAIDDQEIISNRLNTQEITSIPRFANYTPGNVSKTLFVKNVSPKVDRYTLMSLFKKYEDVIDEIRLMRGKMKGQAFVTFKDADKAQDALHFLNGYNLKGKPIVIQFGLLR